MQARSGRPAVLSFPQALPVSEKRSLIAETIEQHQVVIICGETGSGKTTQLPKICLQLGRGTFGRIGHTQPRRMAARQVAARIASELQCEVGGMVGYKVRFNEQCTEPTRIKLMTDGILLAEIRHDPDLLQYDTLIIDEAHERSLNIDFILGYLPSLLKRRPDLKLIVTSATIASDHFAAHFRNAPVIKVTGRTYPVEVRYRPLHDITDSDSQQEAGILDAIAELYRFGSGDILIFLPTERSIAEMSDVIKRQYSSSADVLSLYSRLSVAEQNRIFQSHNRRRIILATNVAETSLTVPGIRFVIDTGLARISRYSYRSKVQRLPVEKISRASALQRQGRCGRTSAGICIRLYDEQDFDNRPEYTEPEIQRTNLAAVILNLKNYGLGNIENFNFIDMPDRRYINDGYRLLYELGAVDEQRILTGIGKNIARLSIDPRLARMVIQADTEHCVKEVLIIVSALEIQDPRERPIDAQQKADSAHSQFSDYDSDFMSYLKLWESYHQHKKKLSRNQLRKWCQRNYLSSARMQEWTDLHRQLLQEVRLLKINTGLTSTDSDALSRALLAGLIGNTGQRQQDKDYLGSHGKSLWIFPGSGLKKSPKWIMAAEIVETQRLYARTVAAINPEWIEHLAPHLIKRSYGDPFWQRRSGHVVAHENLTLYGLTLINRRRINFSHIDPVISREVFIRHALVRHEINMKAECLDHNQRLLQQVQLLENKTRRSDILIDERVIHEFYQQRIPDSICDQAAFTKWWRKKSRNDPNYLNLSEQHLLQVSADSIAIDDWPDSLRVQGNELALEYHFSPGEPDDGVTVIIPAMILSQLQSDDFDYLVPGLLPEKIEQLLRNLPKSLRKNFIPVKEFARATGSAMDNEKNIFNQLSDRLLQMTGVEVPLDAWKPDRIDPYLIMNFRLINDKGEVLAQSRDLLALQSEFKEQADHAFNRQTNNFVNNNEHHSDEIEGSNFGKICAPIELPVNGMALQSYRALVVHEQTLVLEIVDNLEKAEQLSKQGLVHLFASTHRKQINYLSRNIPDFDQSALYYSSLGDAHALQQDIFDIIIQHALKLDKSMIYDSVEYQHRSACAEHELAKLCHDIGTLIHTILLQYHQLSTKLSSERPLTLSRSIEDMRSQLQQLMVNRFLRITPLSVLRHYPRYLQGMQVRLDKLSDDPQRDLKLLAEIEPLWSDYLHEVQACDEPTAPEWQEYHSLLQELRVSLFAQSLKTATKVSVKRLEKFRNTNLR